MTKTPNNLASSTFLLSDLKWSFGDNFENLDQKNKLCLVEALTRKLIDKSQGELDYEILSNILTATNSVSEKELYQLISALAQAVLVEHHRANKNKEYAELVNGKWRIVDFESQDKIFTIIANLKLLGHARSFIAKLLIGYDYLPNENTWLIRISWLFQNQIFRLNWKIQEKDLVRRTAEQFAKEIFDAIIASSTTLNY